MKTTSDTELRKFAWLMTVALSVFATFALYRGGHKIPIVLFAIAGLFLLFGLAFPGALRPAYRSWMAFAHVLAWVNTRIILGLFFYLVITPVSLVMKVIGRDALRLKIDRASSSYWHPRKEMKPAKERYERLF